MERMIMKAVATATDQGVFEAVISTESVDREKDIVSADAMVVALHKWNRPIPLAWNHGLKAEDIFGHVDPQSARNTGGEVAVTGQVDLSSATGGEAWRSFKSRTVGFSFGYLIPTGGSSKRAGGGRTITALDIFEITATPAPMNNDTRVLSTKAMTATQTRILNSMIGQAQEYIAGADDAGDMADVLEALQDMCDGDGDDGGDDGEDDGDDGGKRLCLPAPAGCSPAASSPGRAPARSNPCGRPRWSTTFPTARSCTSRRAATRTPTGRQRRGASDTSPSATPRAPLTRRTSGTRSLASLNPTSPSRSRTPRPLRRGGFSIAANRWT